MGKSKIEWCDRTWNPVTGCTPISAGCANCYAKRQAERFAGPWGLDPEDPFKVTLHPERIKEPMRWRNPSKVFVCSMGDLFHEEVPDPFIIDILSAIATCQFAGNRHTFLLLTKRPERMREIMNHKTVAQEVWVRTLQGLSMEKAPWPLSNVWLGVTAENQEQADARIPILLQTPAVKRFVSMEPMLGSVDLRKLLLGSNGYGLNFTLDALSGWATGCHEDTGKIRVTRNDLFAKLNWVICGGESGANARPMHPNWVRSLRDQCKAAEVPFLFKQWGEWGFEGWAHHDSLIWHKDAVLIQQDGHICRSQQEREINPLTGHFWAEMRRVGKKTAGRLLDSKLWDQSPVSDSHA